MHSQEPHDRLTKHPSGSFISFATASEIGHRDILDRTISPYKGDRYVSTLSEFEEGISRFARTVSCAAGRGRGWLSPSTFDAEVWEQESYSVSDSVLRFLVRGTISTNESKVALTECARTRHRGRKCHISRVRLRFPAQILTSIALVSHFISVVHPRTVS
jgi:hypothetical protein